VKRFRSLKFTSATMAFITFSTFGMGCGPGDMGSGTQQPSAAEAQRLETGRDLYKGMVFGVGPSAHHFDDLWQRPEVKARLEGGAELQSKRELAAETLMAKVDALDPTFFERFGTDLRSGDHLTIDRLLTETKTVTQAAADALRQERGLKEAAVQNVELQAGTWFYEETVVAVAIAAVLLVVVTQIDVTPVMEDQQASALRRDTWVDMLAKKSFHAL